MSAIAVFAKLTAHPGQRDELLQTLEPMMQTVLAEEPGTVVYAVHHDTEDADAIWFYEIFTDQSALEAHAANETRLAHIGAKVQALLAKPIELTWGRTHLVKGASSAI
jgi:quinol monooxygenase YgiN